jgi:hypothetical protein
MMHSVLLRTTNRGLAGHRLWRASVFQIVSFLFCSLFSSLGDDKLKSEFLRQSEKLTRETSPLGKVKVLIKISGLHLQSAADAINKDDFLEADRSLGQYQEAVGQALKALKNSGRNAQKNPAGFKEFEISLRKQLRRLDDLKSRYSFEEAQAIGSAIQTARSAQEEMFAQIFGAENTGQQTAGKSQPREGKNPAREKEAE